MNLRSVSLSVVSIISGTILGIITVQSGAGRPLSLERLIIILWLTVVWLSSYFAIRNKIKGLKNRLIFMLLSLVVPWIISIGNILIEIKGKKKEVEKCVG